jgi:GntR family transcriptional regulator
LTKYREIEKKILEEIKNGHYLPGETLESERILAKKYEVNRMTVKHAFDALTEKGYIERSHGKGTFVKKKNFEKLDLDFDKEDGNTGITALVEWHGIMISNKVLSKGIVNGSRYLSDKLRIGLDEPVFALHRVRYGNEEPIAVEYTYVPSSYFGNIGEMDFKNVSLYDYMASFGKLPKKFNQKLRLIENAEKEAEHLKIKKGSPLYYFEFIGMDGDMEIVEYTESYIRCDKCEFRFTATTKKSLV